MVTWLPAAVAVRERLKTAKCKNSNVKKLKSSLKVVLQLIKKFENWVVDIVINLPLMLVVILGMNLIKNTSAISTVVCALTMLLIT